MTNRFKGLDLVDRGPEELWMEVHNIVQETVTKTIPKKKKYKKAKWLSGEILRIAEKTREEKGKREREIYTPKIQSSREYQGEIRRPFKMNNTKKQMKTIEWERLEVSLRKMEK